MANILISFHRNGILTGIMNHFTCYETTVIISKYFKACHIRNRKGWWKKHHSFYLSIHKHESGTLLL